MSAPHKSGQLDGLHALVVGASSGIGSAIAKRFAQEGARVVVAARRAEQGQALVTEILAAGGSASFEYVDVTDSKSVEALVLNVASRNGPLDIAVNNAGIEGTPFVPTADYEEAVFDTVIDTNLKGVWRCMKFEIPQMTGGGAIINMSSIAGLGGNEMMGCAYTASKHAINGMTKTAAREYAGQGIRINAICPGVIATDIAQRSFMQDGRLERKVLKMHPLGRLGTAEEVADAALYLASKQSSFMTGHTLVLDGGVTS
ncbi:MAG: NAD(P)-dependent dehydrogenase (short-subunit alcohol dehydrogenase family) [Bacteroidia bacterium]|jgi:NAD(P)-dependent dehydrogenase (short-subunit alcohol dehydrogenase family)